MTPAELVLSPPIDSADHVEGSADARWTLVEFGDFECPYCRGAAGAVKQVQRMLGDDLRFVYRNLPLVDIHPHALQAALAAEAAADQGEFWEMHKLLYGQPRGLDSDALLGYADQIGLDVGRFETDLAADASRRRVERDLASAHESGVRHTPSFFIDCELYTGEYDAAALAAAIQRS